jgi:hypothetical protein
MRVRRLPKILDTEEATRLLEVEGFDAAEEYLSKHDPREQELYLVLERARVRLQEMSVSELVQVHDSPERLAILKSLQDQIGIVLANVERFAKADQTTSPPRRRSRAR